MHYLQKKALLNYRSIPITTAILASALGDYSAQLAKVAALVKDGTLIRIKRGLYCLSPEVSGLDLNLHMIANTLYAPSYLSFESALAFYGLIPESVTETMSACAKRGKFIQTSVGAFSYKTVPKDWFSIGIRSLPSGEGNILIASPEKALGDLLLARTNLRIASPKTLRCFLEEDLRFDFDAFEHPDGRIFSALAQCGPKPQLFSALKRIFHDTL
jgi:hypothetical protein